MINDVTIENFKSILKVSLPLGRFNLLIGANGCGKSNILEGIALGAAASSDKLDYEYFYNRGIHVVKPRFMLPAFDNEVANKIRVCFTDEKGITSVFDIHYDINAKPTRWVSDNGKFINSDINQFLIYSPEEYKLRNGDNSNLTYSIGCHGEGLFTYLKDLSQRPEGTVIFGEIRESLKGLDWFDGMEVPSGQLSLKYNLKLKDSYLDDTINTFDQRSTNEGFLYLLFFLTLVISDETPRFFAIENIDRAFNPKLCSEVVRHLIILARKHNKQIIATTHNPAVLDGLDLHDEEQKLIVVQRSIDGYTRVRTLNNDQVINCDLPLSQLWLRGFIGGLPNNF